MPSKHPPNLTQVEIRNMQKFICVLIMATVLGCGTAATNPSASSPSTSTPALNQTSDQTKQSRSFKFTYAAALTDLEPGTDVRVWLPIATSNHDQDVKLLTELPENYERKQSKSGNEIVYFETQANNAGEVPVELVYEVTRREVSAQNYQAEGGAGTEFLAASSMVPVDDTLRKNILAEGSLDVAAGAMDKARRLYDAIETHMEYDKPLDRPGWGRGDAAWACANGFGNCTDFHSLFISAARNLQIPARFEIGFPIPAERGAGEVGGYHCWAKFLADGKWVPVDISEADKHPELKEYYFGNLTPDRVTFSVGRDLVLEPAPAAGPVNYLVYPYAEVDGKQHKKFRKAFRYEDLANAAE